jgi:hypothetical protein
MDVRKIVASSDWLIYLSVEGGYQARRLLFRNNPQRFDDHAIAHDLHPIERQRAAQHRHIEMPERVPIAPSFGIGARRELNVTGERAQIIADAGREFLE